MQRLWPSFLDHISATGGGQAKTGDRARVLTSKACELMLRYVLDDPDEDLDEDEDDFDEEGEGEDNEDEDDEDDEDEEEEETWQVFHAPAKGGAGLDFPF
jgi:hypothetical protein